jgi:hypothetical protein
MLVWVLLIYLDVSAVAYSSIFFFLIYRYNYETQYNFKTAIQVSNSKSIAYYKLELKFSIHSTLIEHTVDTR